VLAETETQASRIDAAAAAASDAVDQEAARRRGELTAAFDQQQAQADEAHAGMRARVSAEQSASTGSVGAAAVSARRGVQEQASQSQQAAVQHVERMSAETGQHADAQAERATSGAEGQLSALPTPAAAPEPELAEGQQKLHSAVAGKARGELTRSGDAAATDIKRRAAERQRAVYAPARKQATSQVRQAAQQADSALEQGRATADASVTRTAGHARDAAAEASRTVARGLGKGRADALDQLGRWSDDAKDRIRTVSTDLAEHVRRHGSEIAGQVRSGGRAAQNAVDAVRAGGNEVVGAVTDTANSVIDGTGQLADAHRTAVEGVGGQLRSAYASAADTGARALRDHAQAFAQHAEQASASAAAELQAAPQRASQALAGEHAKGLAEMSEAADTTARNQTAWVSDAGAKAGSGASRYNSEAQRLGQQAQQTQVQGWFSELVGRMRSWLKDKLGDVLGGIVSGIILSLPAIIVALILVFSGPVGWVVLAGLFVVGAGLGIYGRFKDYAADHGGQGPSFLEGTALVLLGIADVTGVPYIVEAIVGQRAFAPKPMTSFERWERGTQGVINLALIAAGGAKKLFGEGGGGVGEPVPDSGGVPGEKGTFPGERGPSESVPEKPTEPTPARQPITQQRMVELIRQMESKSDAPVEFTPEHAEALRMNAELASKKWLQINQDQGRVPWDSIRNQMNLSRWRFLPQAPEAEAVLRKALLQLPDVPERAEMLAKLDAWVGRGPGSGGATPSGPGGDQGPPGGGTSDQSAAGGTGTPIPVAAPNPHHDEDKNQPGSS
jgi:hypothetical protein